MMNSILKKQLYFLSFLAMLSFVAVSCGDDEEPVDECVTTDLTYTNSVKALLDNSCASSACHSAANKDVIGSLENYTDVKEFIDGGFPLIGAINHEEGVSNMPKGGSKLDQCDIDKITAWVNAGAPE